MRTNPHRAYNASAAVLELVTSSTTSDLPSRRASWTTERLTHPPTARSWGDVHAEQRCRGCALGLPVRAEPGAAEDALGVPRLHEPGPLDPFAPVGLVIDGLVRVGEPERVRGLLQHRETDVAVRLPVVGRDRVQVQGATRFAHSPTVPSDLPRRQLLGPRGGGLDGRDEGGAHLVVVELAEGGDGRAAG